MFKKDKKSINFLEPVITSSDVLGNAYIWLFKIGKYLLLSVEMVVLMVFFARFILDKQNNDLTESINDKVALLSNTAWTRNAVRFENFQELLVDISKVREGQDVRSSVVSEILSGIPSELTLNSFSLVNDQVSLYLASSSLEPVNNYEFSLKQSQKYTDVSFSISEKDGIYEVRVTFNLSE